MYILVKWVKCCIVLTTRGPLTQCEYTDAHPRRTHTHTVGILLRLKMEKTHAQSYSRVTYAQTSSLPFSPASMLIVMTQMHPSPTARLPSAHAHTHRRTHQTSLLLAFTQRDANSSPPTPPPFSRSVSLPSLDTHTHITDTL